MMPQVERFLGNKGTMPLRSVSEIKDKNLMETLVVEQVKRHSLEVIDLRGCKIGLS